MTPSELFEVVKDVPREAWPSLVYHAENWYCKDDNFILSTLGREPEEAALLFEASMTRWLAPQGCSLHAWDDQWKVRVPKSGIGPDYPEQDIRYRWTTNFRTAVEALAAACKAMGGGK